MHRAPVLISAACSKMECPELCHGNGRCVVRVVVTFFFFFLLQTFLLTLFFFPPSSLLPLLQAGDCVCHTGFIGVSCQTIECPRGCSGHGECLVVDHVNPFDNKTVTDGVTCHCQEGWGGDEGDCRVNVRCVDECGFTDGRGRCQEGRCYCADGYGGEGCKDRVCMNACSGHGTCTVRGREEEPVCTCADTWKGEMCDQRECPRGGT